MKKVGIITIIGYDNYGNRLQNYAVQELLKSREFNVETILNFPESQNSKLSLKFVFKEYLKKLRNYSRDIKYKTRRNMFEEFTRNYIKESSFIVTNDNKHIDDINSYAGLVVGSDQVWNPIFRKMFFLDLVKGIETPAISLSASFGISEIPKKFIKDFKINLSNFKSISVRENEGQKIVENFLNITPQVTLDPTLMLPKK